MSRKHGLDDIEVSHAHTTARHDGIAGLDCSCEHLHQGVLVVAHDAEVRHLASRVTDHAVEHRQVALADLTRLQWRAIDDQLIASGQQRHSRASDRLHASRINAREHSDASCVQHLTDAEHRRTRRHVASLVANRTTRLCGLGEFHEIVADHRGVLHHHDCIHSRRDDCTSHDAHRLTGSDRNIGRSTGRERADDAQAHGNGQCVLAPHTESVDRGVRKRRNFFGCNDVLCEHATDHVGGIHFDDGQHLTRIQHLSTRVFDGDHLNRRYCHL